MVTVNTAELKVMTARLTKSLFMQLQEVHLRFTKDGPMLMQSAQDIKLVIVLGWVHGSVLNEDYQTWLIVDCGEGHYGRYAAKPQMRERFKQIYIV